MVLTTYIVRVYKFKKNQPRKLVGVVEEVGIKGRKAFTDYDDLWDILNSSVPPLSSLSKKRSGVGANWVKIDEEKGGE